MTQEKSHFRKNCEVLLTAVLVASMIIGPNAAWAVDVNALPTGGQITAGSGAIHSGGSTMTVTQTSDKLIAQWGSFNIGQNAAVNFAQPGSQSIALNRIIDQNPSQILGHLNANGQIFLLNPAGIIFGQTAQVNVGGLVASTLNMSDTDFLNDNFHFVGNGDFSKIINQGQINTSAGGVVAFLSTSVKNEGAINTPQGTTALLAAKDIRLDFAGDGLISYRIEQGAVDALTANHGLIKADGGLVLLSAKAADLLSQSVVNNAGIIEAQTLVNKNGHIFLDAIGGQTTVAGVLDASAPDGVGGEVIATGDRVLIKSGAHLTASGATGGGEVLVGGSWQGSNPTIHQAVGTIVEQGAVLEANTTDTGNGGTVVAWSDITNADSVTRAYGTFEAMAGANGGDGGRIETSGHWLDTTGVAGSAAATMGQAGEWLFDPYNVTISGAATGTGSWGGANPDIWTPNGNNSTILNTDINSKLEGGTSVTVTTGAAGAQSGDITVNSGIIKATGNTDVTLTMRAENSIIQQADISNTGGTGKLNVVLDADYDNAGNGDGIGIILLKNNITTNGGNLSFGTGRTVTINSGNTTVMVGGDVYVGGAAGQTISTNGGNVDVKGEMIVANTNGLTIDSANGNVRFYGVLDSGNSSYVYTANPTITWDNAVIAAKGVTGDGSNVGDTYLATITSRLENSIATTARGSNKAWLGGARGATGTEINKWRWKTGPEGLEDTQNGRHFFTQNMSGTTAVNGGTTVAGEYSNWDLTNSWAEPSGGTENKLQFAGGLGFWNDINYNNSSWIDGYLTETNLATSPVTITASSGTVTFSGLVGGGKHLASLDVTSTGGIAIDGGAVTTEGLQAYIGNVTLGAASTVLTQTGVDKDFTQVAGKSISNATSSDANLTIKTTRNIIMDRTYDSVNFINHPSFITSPTGKLNTVLWADSDNNSTGGIYLQQDTSITTNGGNLTMGGGTDPLTGSAVGNGTGPGLYNNYGVYLGSNVAVTTTGGNINIHGKSSLGAAFVSSSGVSVTTTGSGTLTIVGDASGSPNGYSQGFNSNNGIFSTKTGNLSITGLSGGNDVTDRFSYGLMVGKFSTTTGNITLTASQGVGQEEAGLWFSSDADTITSTSGDITLNVDDISKGSVFASNQISSSGNIVVAPYTSGRKIVLSATGTTSDLVIDSSFFSAGLKNGFTSVTVGNATAGAITVGGATTFNDKTTLQSNSTIAVDGAITANENLTLKSGGAISQSKALGVTGTTSITAGTNAVTLDNTSNNFGGAVSVVSAGNLTVVDSNAMSLGAITSSGTVDVATLTNDLTLTGTISTTDTTTSAIQLNAAKSTAAGTSTGGDIIVSTGGSVSTGTNGRSTLYSGSVSGSTGLTTLIGSATGNFRYNSDETATNYTTALSSGKYAIYREQPTLTYTADNETLTYGTGPAKTATLSGLQNSDTSAQAISTAATVAVGGSISTSNNYIAGTHTLTASGAAGGLGYGFNYTGGTLTVNQQALTISGLTASNRIYDTTAVASLGGTAAVTALGSDVVTVGGTAAGVFADKTVANAKAITVSGNTISGTDAGNYVLAQQSGLTANITPATLTISGLTASNKVYDATAAATLGGTAAVTALSGDTVTVGGTAAGVFADKAVANAKVITVSGNTISGTDAGNYVIAQQTGLTANITAKALTLAGFTASNKVYDANTSATISNAGSLSGVIAGDTVSVNNGGATFADKNAATGKTVTLSGVNLGGTDGGNYSIAATTTNTADITKANLEVSGLTASNRTYDATTVEALGGTATVTALGGDTVTLGGTATGAFGTKNVSTAKAVTVSGNTLSGTDAANYALVQQTGLMADITAKALTLTGFTAANKVYDANTSATISNSGSLSGVIAGDTVSVNNGGATFADKNAATGKTVTLSGVNLGGTDGGNYSIAATVTNTANITAKALTISGLTALNKVYDATAAATLGGTAAVTVLGSDTVTVGGTASGVFADKTVANAKAITVSGNSLSGTDAGNYVLAQQSGLTANITAKALTLAGFTAANKVYDANTSASINNAGSLSGVITGDTVSVNNGGATFADKNVATGKSVTLSGVNLSGTDSGNYSIAATVTNTANITPASLTISGLTASNKGYDATAVATLGGTAAVTALSGDTVTVGGTAAGVFADKTVANAKAITVSGNTVSGADAGNYVLAQQSGLTANITAKALTLAGFTAANKVYDANTSATISNAGSLSGVIAGDTVSVNNGGATFADKNAATGKTVTLSGLNLGGTDSGNYSIAATTTNTADIAAKALGLNLSGQGNKVYDGNSSIGLSGVTPTLTGVISGDTVTVGTGSVTGFVDKNVANNKGVTFTGFSISGADVANYSLVSGSAASTANITAKAITLAGFIAANKVYDANTTATISNAGSLSGVIAGDAVSVNNGGATFADKNVATGKTVTLSGLNLSGTDGGNYSIAGTVTNTANITAKSLTISGLTASNRGYDATAVATLGGTAAVTALSGDTVTVGGTAAGVFADKTVANAKAITVSGNTISGTDAGNYVLAQQSGLTANITAKALTLAGFTAVSKVYDANTSAIISNAGSLSGVIAGDTVSVNNGGATFADKNAATGKTVTLSGINLSGIDSGNYSIAATTTDTADIAAKALGLNLSGQGNKVYDGNSSIGLSGVTPTLTGVISGDTVTVGTGSVTGFVDKNVANNKGVTFTGFSISGADVANYSLISGSAVSTANIIAKNLTVGGVFVDSKIYDGTTASAINVSGAVYTGLVAGDAFNVTATGLFADSRVGSGKTVVLSSSYAGADVGNYNITDQVSTTANITPALLSVTANNDSKTYDGLAYAGGNGVVYSGFVNSEDESVLAGAPVYGGTAQGATVAGTYGIAASGLTSANYTLSFIDGVLTILSDTSNQGSIPTSVFSSILSSQYSVNGTQSALSLDPAQIRDYEIGPGKGASSLGSTLLGGLIVDRTGYRQEGQEKI